MITGVALASFLVTIAVMWQNDARRAFLDIPQPPSVAAIDVPDPLASVPAVETVRRIYRYSVVPGGVHSVAEFVKAIETDPVVAAHYASVNPQMLRASFTTEPQWAYVSYRRGDDIYWTSRKLYIPKGEAVLTDGQTTVRARCANAISVQPLMPVAVEEPPPLEFDLTEPPVVLAALPPTTEPPGDPGDPPPPIVPPPPPPDPPVFVPLPPPPVTPVPEPGTLVLVGLGGAAGLVQYLRRRQR